MSIYTLGQWLERWLTFYAPLRCASGVTLERYQRLADYLFNETTRELGVLCGTLLSDLTHQTLEDALLSLLTVKTKRKERLSKRSVHHVAGLLSSALAKASRLDLIPNNPMARVELPPAEKPETRSLSIEEITRLRETCRGDWTYLFVELAMATGCRRGELLALTWEDINWHTSVLAVTKSLEETRNGLRLKPTKNGRKRSCTLPQSVMILLPRYNGKGELNTGLLFPGEQGDWRIPAYVSQTIVRRMQKAGIRKASLHSLRHTHGSVLLSNGVPVPAVSKRLGHCDPAVTLRVYGHAMPPDDIRAADEWDRLLERMQG